MTIAPVVIGVDPGASETGVVMRQGEREWGFEVVVRKGGWPAYLGDVTRVVAVLRSEQAQFRVPPEIAVEDVVAPNPHMGMMNPGSLIGTAKVLGAVLSAFPDAIVVPPGGNGSGPLNAYPKTLRPTRGKGAGKDKLRHCRSAWDVAGIAATLLKIGAA